MCEYDQPQQLPLIPIVICAFAVEYLASKASSSWVAAMLCWAVTFCGSLKSKPSLCTKMVPFKHFCLRALETLFVFVLECGYIGMRL